MVDPVLPLAGGAAVVSRRDMFGFLRTEQMVSLEHAQQAKLYFLFLLGSGGKVSPMRHLSARPHPGCRGFKNRQQSHDTSLVVSTEHAAVNEVGKFGAMHLMNFVLRYHTAATMCTSQSYLEQMFNT